jgi:hypothetical protein
MNRYDSQIIHRLECPGLNDRRLVVQFVAMDDSICEQWLIESDHSRQLILSSLCQAAAPWPPSPAWQEMVGEVHQSGPVILGIGRAGRSHWSAVWQVELSNSLVDVQVACRIHDVPERLGTTFQIAEGVPFELISSGQPLAGVRVGKLVLHSGQQTRIDISSQSVRRMTVRPDEDDTGTLPATRQWTYRISFTRD